MNPFIKQTLVAAIFIATASSFTSIHAMRVAQAISINTDPRTAIHLAKNDSINPEAFFTEIYHTDKNPSFLAALARFCDLITLNVSECDKAESPMLSILSHAFANSFIHIMAKCATQEHQTLITKLKAEVTNLGCAVVKELRNYLSTQKAASFKNQPLIGECALYALAKNHGISLFINDARLAEKHTELALLKHNIKGYISIITKQNQPEIPASSGSSSSSPDKQRLRSSGETPAAKPPSVPSSPRVKEQLPRPATKYTPALSKPANSSASTSMETDSVGTSSPSTSRAFGEQALKRTAPAPDESEKSRQQISDHV